MSLGSYPQNTVAAEISKYMGNAVQLSSIWGGVITNVKASPFLAKGDGVTDDTAAIAAAIATGNTIFFPPGTYLTGPQTISTQGQILYGAGTASTIKALNATTNLLTVQAAYVTIRDLRLNGVATSNANNFFAISTNSANAATYLTIERVLISGADSTVGFNNAIKFDDNCHFGTVINCRIERLWGNISGTGYGVLIGNAKGCRIQANKIIATSGRGRHGVYVSGGASDNVVHANYIEATDQEGISQFSIGAQPPCARNIYSNNTLVNCSNAGTNQTSGAIGIYQHSNNAMIIGNTITGSGTIGIAVDGTSVTDCMDTVITGNIVNYSAVTGISIIAAVGGILANNKIKESSQTTTGLSANINLKSDGTTTVSDWNITGNHSSGPTKARCAFRLDPTTPVPTNNRVYGNKFDPCVGGTTLELNGVTCELDGRIQFRQDSVSYGPIANGASVSASYSIPGADVGDTVTVSHSSDQTGCVLHGFVNAAGNVTVVAANFSGGSKTIASGSLRIDCWKRVAPLN